MAKKMYLVDQRTMDKLNSDTPRESVKHKENWTKSAFDRSKTSLSQQMKRILEDDLDDDVKAKQYRQVLSRFLNTQKIKVKEEDSQEDSTQHIPVPSTPIPPIAKTESKKKKAKTYKAKRSCARVKHLPSPARTRRSKRISKKVQWLSF